MLLSNVLSLNNIGPPGRYFLLTLHACHQIHIIACGLYLPHHRNKYLIRGHTLQVGTFYPDTAATLKATLDGVIELGCNIQRTSETDAGTETRFSLSVKPRLLGYISTADHQFDHEHLQILNQNSQKHEFGFI